MVHCDAPRYTAAGVEVRRMVLAHESSQREAGSERRVVLKLGAVILGATGEPPGPEDRVRLQGFLMDAHRGGVELHVTEWRRVAREDSTDQD